jgi:PAS domain S-box-containing protein
MTSADTGTAADGADAAGTDMATAALRDSEQRFRLMADTVPQIVWITDADGRVEFFNKQWSDYTGVPYEPTTAAAVAATFVHPDDGAATVAAFDEARRIGGTFAVEHRIRSAAGDYRWFLVRAEPYRDPVSGEIVRWFGASVDIHDRKQAEAEVARLLAASEAARADAERARAQADAARQAAEGAWRLTEAERARATGILEAVADAYFALDRDFRIVAVNAAMERSTGLARDALLGRVFWEVFPATVGTAYEHHYRAAATEGATARFTDRYDDGRLALVSEADVYPVAGGGVAVFWRDITARVRADAERERLLHEAEAARAEAERANRAKSEFLAVMSHELRTPLNAIGGYAELLELGIHGTVTEAQRTALERIQRSQRHLLGLIAGVLDYSRVEAGAVTYRLADVPVTEAVAEAEALVAPQLRAKGLGYAWSGAAPGLTVRADREKLQQILLNLLGNAVKFTDARDGVPGRIEVTCAVEPDGPGGPGGRVAIHVRDTGEGIAPEQLERIFEPFVQADQRLTRPHAGVGLGLAISRDLALGMGGELTAESTPAAGSTFTLVLPRTGRDRS